MSEQLYKKILLPLDGSKFAEKAVNDAIFIAKSSNAEIILLTVVENSFLVGLPADNTTMEINKLLETEAQKNIDKIKKHLDDIKTTTIIKEGSPAEAILKTIEKENIDLVIMGSSGKKGFEKFIIGSVTDKVVNSARCKIMVIH